MGRVISTAIQFVDRFTRPSAQVIRNMQRMGREFQRTGRQIQNAGKSISGVGSSIAKAVTLPVAGIATAAVKTAADFESAMSEVGAISGASAKDMEKLTEKAKQMGATTAFSASESAEAMKYMAMAGWKTKEMTGGIAGIMNLAAASGENLGTASDIVTDALTAFGMRAEESSRFADVLAATSNNANTNVSMMGESFKYCASAAGAMKYKVEDISVALGIMANAGIKGSTAGTTLKNIIANMSKPTDTQAAMMEKLGVSLTDGHGKIKSFDAVMHNLRSSFSGLSETEKASAAATLAGKESMSGLLTIVNASDKDFKKLTKSINGSSGAAEKMAGKMLDNLNGQITLLKSAIEGILITLGDKLLPHIKKVVIWVQNAADWINNLSSAQVNNIMKWAGIAAAIGPAIAIFGKIVTTIGKARSMFGKITTTIGNFGGILKTITSPAGIVIITLAAIAGAAVLIIKNWDKVQGFLKNVGKWFKDAFKKAGTSVQNFKNNFSSIGNSIKNIADKISGIFKSIGGIFKKEFATNVKSGTKQADGALKIFTTGTVKAFDGILTAVDRGLKIFSSLLSFFTGAFAGNWHNAIMKFKHSLYNIFPPDIAAKFSKTFDKALPKIKTVINGIKNAFSDVFATVDKGFKVFNALLKFFTGAFAGNWHNATMTLKHNLYNIFPPDIAAKFSKAFDTALPVIKGVVEGIKGAFGGLIKDIKIVAGDVKKVFKGLGTVFKGIFSGDAETALKGFQTAAGGILDTVRDIFKTKINAIKNFTVNAVKNFLPESAINTIATAFDIVAERWDLAVKLIKSGIDGFVQAIKPLLENIKTIFKGLGQFVSGVFTGNWKQALNGLKNIAKGVFGGLINIIKAPFKIIGNVIKNATKSFNGLNIVKSIFTSLGNTIKKVMAKFGVNIEGFTKNLKGIKTHASSILNNIKGVFNLVFGAIGKAVKTASIIIAAVFGKKIGSTCSTAKAAVTALKTVAVAGFKFLGNSIKNIMGIIAPAVMGTFGAIAGFISSSIDTVVSVVKGLMKVFDGLIKFVTGVFTGDWTKAWQGVVDIFGGIFDTLGALIKAPINAVIGIINGAIGGINKIGFTIPDWVPKIGGQKFGINVPTIPMLYKGTNNWPGGAAVVHDRGGEIIDLPKGSRVYPHDKSIEMARREGKGGITINIQKLADKIEVRNDEDIDRIAEALAYKLKMVALNTGLA